MKVTEIVRQGEYGEDAYLEVELVTDQYTGSVEFGEGEPEDMTLGRDLSSAYSISSLLEEAYKAGQRGESFSFERIDEEEEE